MRMKKIRAYKENLFTQIYEKKKIESVRKYVVGTPRKSGTNDLCDKVEYIY